MADTIKGLFDLSFLESAGDDDIMNLNLSENAQEFDNKCPSSNPTAHFEPDNSGNKQISVPGGDSETPKAKPADGEMGPSIPGGDKEAPNAKPYDSTSMISSGKETLTEDQYNAAMANLQKSFKEAADIMAMLQSANIVKESVEDMAFNAANEAFTESLASGILFERVDRDDKSDVKDIVKNIRGDVDRACGELGVKFYKPALWARFLSGLFFGVDLRPAFTQFIGVRMWQVLGICLTEPGNTTEVASKLTSKFSSELGDYKILPYQIAPTIADYFRLHFHIKDVRKTYLLLVDKKIPGDMDSAQSALVKQMDAAKSEKDKGGDKK